MGGWTGRWMALAALGLAACGSTEPTEPPPTPGAITLHRLNRVEYDNTVRDLFGTALRPAADLFPADDFGYGFDNNADVSTVSRLVAQKYMEAAETIAASAVAWASRSR